MELINIGFGNLISAQRLISIVSPDSAPVKRLIPATAGCSLTRPTAARQRRC